MNLRILKIVTILGPALFIGFFEFARHLVFIEQQPMMLGNLLVFGAFLVGAFLFSRLIFGVIERMQRESLRRNQELAALNSVSLAVSESLDLDVVLYRALDKVLQVTDTEAGEIFLLDEETQKMVRRVHTGLFPEAFQETTKFQKGEDLAEAVAQSGEPTVVPNPSQNPRLLKDKVKDGTFGSLASVPLKSKNTVIGAINIASLSRRRFTPDDMRLLTSIGNQIAVAIENARLHEQVQGMAALEERERIAREMHDGLAQVLSYVSTKTQAVGELISTGQGDEAKTQLKELEDIAQTTYADVREAILSLRSSASPQRGIIATLKEYIFRFSQMSNIRTELQVSNGKLPLLPMTTELQAIRIIQEALTNVRKHAKASHAWVNISSNGNQTEIVIEDDGRGFDISNIRRGDWPQFGLQTMRERAESVKGTLEIRSTPGQGTKVILRMPQPQREGR